MQLRRRVVFGFVAVTMVGVSMPEARAARVVPMPAVRMVEPRPVAVAVPMNAVSVVSFNACGGVCRHGEVTRTAAHVATVADAHDAAVVLLQELCYSQYVRIRGLLGARGYVGRFAASTKSKACVRDERRFGAGFGVAVLVRSQITGSVVLPLPTTPGFERRAMLGVTTLVGGRSTFVAVVHLSPSPAAGLDRQLAVVARDLNQRLAQPVIVGGDFNSLPDKAGLTAFYSPTAGGSGHFLEADESRGGRAARGGAATFDIAGRKIDYVFLSDRWFTAARARSFGTPLSDHRVYVATAHPTR